MKKLLFLILVTFSLTAFAQEDTLLTENGLKFILVKKGNGITPKEGQKLKVSYIGKFLNGEVFEKLEDGDSFFFKLGDPTIIKGWNEGFKLMSAGEKAIFIVPPYLAYGTKGVKDPYGEKEFMIPPNSTLIYEVELINIK